MGTTNLFSTALGGSCLHATYIARASHTVDWDVCQMGRCIYFKWICTKTIGLFDLLAMARLWHYLFVGKSWRDDGTQEVNY